MQMSLRLFLLVFASILVGAMLSGQRKSPQKKPAFRDRPSATSFSRGRTFPSRHGWAESDPKGRTGTTHSGRRTAQAADDDN